MLGGHLDSWHSATGATDNAIGCAIMMEAARILKAIGVQPRRTIRVALWSGEEEGLLGSQAYVKEHFGSFENQKPEFAKLDALPEHRLRHRPRARRRRVRAAGGRGDPARRRWRRSTISASVGASATTQPRRSAAPTARRSTTPACRASASARIRSNTTPTRITRISTPTSASSKTT